MAKLQKLSLESLDLLDMGKISATLETHLKRTIIDCTDRPADAKARSVTMQFDLVPVLSDDMSCTEVKLQVSCKSTVPVHRTRVYSTGVRQTREGPMLVFNQDSPGNINQGTFTEDEDE
jgi:hypothetical protein